MKKFTNSIILNVVKEHTDPLSPKLGDNNKRIEAKERILEFKCFFKSIF
jgi:hypothetical protein